MTVAAEEQALSRVDILPDAAPDATLDATESAPDAPAGARPWWDPTGVISTAARVPRRIEKRLANQPLARLGLAGPRTARFIAGKVLGDDLVGVPHVRITPALVGHVAMDESIMALAIGPNRFPSRADYHRVADELARARALFDERGWLDDPVSYHRTPPPLEEVAVSRGWALGERYERLWWPSSYEPHLGAPGTDRWLAFEANRTASAWILRHRDKPRPWIVCVHGLGTGSAFMDLFTFRAAHMHHELGANVAAIVLPVHGARRPSRLSGEEFLGFEFMNSVHGLTQALWDLRRLLSWVRLQDPTGVGVFGVSLGGLVAALLGAVDGDLDMLMAGIPIIDFPALIEHHAPRNLYMRSLEHHIMDGTAQDVHKVVSPLGMPTLPRPEARAIFAGLGDRLATAHQAQRLWEHWSHPDTCWFPGNHVGYLWSDKVWKFVTESIEKRDLSARPAEAA